MLRKGLSLALWGLAFACPLVFESTGRADFVVLPPDSIVSGKTIGEYSAEMWQWSLAFSGPNNPFDDTTGALAGMNQSGPVFFVAGTAGTNANRSYTVPANKYLLVPLLSGELSQLEIGFDKTAAEVRQAAKDQADFFDELHASIDGVAVPNLFSYRVSSPDFSFVAAANNPFGVPAGDSGIAVADGYFLLIGPLNVGETHVLNFGGAASQFGFAVDVTATITAVPEPGSLLMVGVGLTTLFTVARLKTRPSEGLVSDQGQQ